MDNLSHGLFGASIVHAIWGKKYGHKAWVFALLASSIPDLDVVARFIPGVTDLQASFFHRTTLHSLLFALVVSPIVGYIAMRSYKTGKTSRKDWTLITLVCILSHIFLDWCTTYGIWFLRPFSRHGFEGNIINVVDFFFTIPLLGIVLSYFLLPLKKSVAGARRYVWVVFAACYLLGMTYVQHRALEAVERDMKAANVQYESIFLTPLFFQPFLWHGIVSLPDGNYKLTYMSARDKGPRTYENVAWNHACASVLRRDVVASSILDRTSGLYTCMQEGSTYKVVDLRFGRTIGRDRSSIQPATFAYLVDPTVSPYRITQTHQHISGSLTDLRSKHWERVWWNR